VRKFYWLLFAIIATAAIAIACDDGGDNGDDNGDETAVSRETPQGGDGDETAEPTQDDGDDDDGDGGGGDAGALDDAVDRFERSTFTTTYEATDTDTENPLNGTVTMYKDGTDRFRMDITGTFEGQEATFIVIETPDLSSFCIEGALEFAELLGLPEGEEGVCFESDPTGGAGFGNLAEELRNFNAGDFEVLETESRTVAGRDADCYTLQEEGAEEVEEICIDDDGVLVYVRTEGATTTLLEATDVQTDVSDGDFELPYEVRELPGFGGG
jgi:hypothetical protein